MVEGSDVELVSYMDLHCHFAWLGYARLSSTRNDESSGDDPGKQ